MLAPGTVVSGLMAFPNLIGRGFLRRYRGPAYPGSFSGNFEDDTGE